MFTKNLIIGQDGISSQLEANIIHWLNWNLLGSCAFFNINLPTSGSYGGQAAKLRLSSDNNYTSGQVWESFRKQWIWQSGVGCGAGSPINISGVYVNNIYRPASGVGPHSFKVDYPNGRIIFNSAIATTSTVKVEYSFNYYQIYNVDSPWWSEIQRNSFRVDDSSFLINGSGFWNRSPSARVQLPAIIVEATPFIEKVPRQLGNLAFYHKQDFRFYIIAESNRDRKWIVDMITEQKDAQYQMFDSSQLRASGYMPINYDGSINPIAINYPDMVNNFSYNRPWGFEKFRGWAPENMRSQDNSPLFCATLNATIGSYT